MLAVRKIHFCSGHRVLNHESKCANAHGHNYVLWAYAEPIGFNGLDSIGRVIDFSVIKEKLGGWIEEFWDHSFLIYKEDKELMNIREVLGKNKPPYICSFNPTAEEMGKFLIEKVCPDLFRDTGVMISKIVLYETENCFIEVTL